MRNSIVFLSSSPGVWGAEKSLLTLASNANSMGHTVSLVCTSQSLAIQWEKEVNDDYEILEIDRDSGRLKRSFAFFKNVKLIDKESNIVLFSYELLSIAPLLKARFRAPITLDLHDQLLGSNAKLLLRSLTPFVDRTIAVSKFTGEQVSKNIHILHRPVTPPASQIKTVEGSFQIGIIGRLNPEKNHRVLFDSYTLARDFCENMQIRVRGEADNQSQGYLEELKAFRDADSTNQIFFDGNLPIEALYSGLTCVVVCNSHEPMGRSVIEAQLSGVITVVPDQGGARELVQDDVTGFIYKSNSPSDLASVLLKVYALTEEERKTILDTARKSALISSSPIAYTERYLELLGA